ncbi:MAG: hypothetical protein AKCLJLPJ_02487 [Fimbriimonadales bacterium]|nr:hypothetical protein [Fimbriimonadales bacterium]
MTTVARDSALTLSGRVLAGPGRRHYGRRKDEHSIARESVGVASSESVRINVCSLEPALTLTAPYEEDEPTWFGIRVDRSRAPFVLLGSVAQARTWDFKRELEDDDGG